MTLTVGSLFSGIGGIDLGLERAGMQVRWQVEIDAWCRAVLTKHWPDVERFADVREVGAHNLAPVDVIAGGFPCQDISDAGKRAGITGERSGLWIEYARLIRELRPRYVLVENVAALRSRGLGVVLGDLAALGYDAEWDCIPASAVGAPHQRDRIWIVAHPARIRDGQPRFGALDGGAGRRGILGLGAISEASAVVDSERARLEGHTGDGDDGSEWTESSGSARASGLRSGAAADVADADLDPRRGRNADRSGKRASDMADTDSGRREVVGLSEPRGVEGSRGGVADGRGGERELDHATRAGEQWLVEPDVGRVAHGIPARVDRLRGLGNAVVPQVVEWIGRRIVEADEREQVIA